MEALAVQPIKALIRLRAHAFPNGMTACEVARAMVERRPSLTSGEWRRVAGEAPGPTR